MLPHSYVIFLDFTLLIYKIRQEARHSKADEFWFTYLRSRLIYLFMFKVKQKKTIYGFVLWHGANHVPRHHYIPADPPAPPPLFGAAA